MTHRRTARRGNAMIEFTLVGIPIIFVLISVFEIARGMWIYHTLAHATREGTRFVIVHGSNCTSAPNQCGVTVAQIAARIRDAGVGLDTSLTQVTLQNIAGTTPFSTVGPSTVAVLLNDNTLWPPGPGNAVGNDVVITATFPFQSAIAMFWPGAGRPFQFAAFTLPAMSRDKITF